MEKFILGTSSTVDSVEIVFILLKITNVVTWPWFYIVMPYIVAVLFSFVLSISYEVYWKPKNMAINMLTSLRESARTKTA